MKTVGIVCEYNPFHNGHLYQIQKAKEITKADYVVVIMSGNFVQRGTPAIIDKHSRTKLCLLNGVDLVVELPVFYSTASAEYFATGAISILEAMNCIDYLCFGCENDDLNVLSEIADFLLNEDADFKENLKSDLKKGLSYAKSRSRAISNSLDMKINIDEIVSSPNNILGIEYIKALKKTNSKIEPITVKRIGSGYNSTNIENEYCSATSIRNYINNNLIFDEIDFCVPYEISKHIKYPIFEDDFSLILGNKLLSNCEFYDYFGVSETLSMKINKYKNNYNSFIQFSKLLKSKDNTLTGINRALIHIILDIRQEDIDTFSKNSNEYIRILGFKKASSNLLTVLKEKTKLSIISKLADSKDILSNSQYSFLEKNIHADNLYRLVLMNKYNISIKNEYENGIVINS